MALLLTFDELKATGINNAKPYGVCEDIHKYMRALDYQMLIDAAIADLVYLYRSGIVTDALLAEVDEVLLNANGIYTTSQTVTNSLFEVFIFGTAEVTVLIDNGEHHNVTVMGTGIAHVTVSNNSYCKVQTYQSAVADVTINDTSICCINARQQSIVTVTQNGNSMTDIMANGDSELTLVANETSYSFVTGLGHSIIDKSGIGTVDQKLYELSSNPEIIVLP